MIKKRYLAPLFILGGAAILSAWLAKTHWAAVLETASLERRFTYRGECRADSNLVLVLWDDSSAAKLEPDHAFRETMAVVIHGLAKMRARVIAADFRFEERIESFSDSLLSAAFSKAPNGVTGFWPRRLYEPDEAVTNPAKRTLEINEYQGFLRASKAVYILPELRHSRARLGHISFSDDTVAMKARFVPLYIVGDTTRAAFALESAQICFGITDRQIKVIDGKLALLPAGREPIRIPMNKFGEYEINFLGAEAAFARRHSLHEVYDLCRKVIADTTAQAVHRDFTDKIVLIGSIIDDDVFVTPFSEMLPGVFIHATVIDNILREQFLTRSSRSTEWAIMLVVGVLMFWLFTATRLEIQYLGAALLLAGYAVLTFVVFDQALIVTPIIPVTGFILTATAVQSVYLLTAARQRQKIIKMRIREIVNTRTQLRLRKQFHAMVPSPHWFFVIDTRENPHDCVFIYWLKRVDAGDPGLAPFEPEIKVSRPVQRNTLNKLEHDIQNLWQRYSRGNATSAGGATALDEELKNIGTRIVNDFGLKQIFRELFDRSDSALPLKLAVTNLKIPWHWAFIGHNKRFLCENFSLGFTFFDSDKERFPGLARPEPKHKPGNAAGKMALLFYGDWQGHPQKQLQHVHRHMIKLNEQLLLQDCSTMVIREKSQDFLNLLTKACSEGCNLRLIHYTGHAEKGFLHVGENDYLPSDSLAENSDLAFPSRPLVFLNACSSGQLSEKRDKMDNLCTAFLACGAGACIVTNFDVYEKTANRFAQIFYGYFVAQNLAAGEALRLTIHELAKPDKKHDYDPDHDLTRYFYALYGDPTVKF